MMPLVSIIIPVFNAEPWLRQTLESALGQGDANIEIILVDDGSTDQSLAIARQYDRPNFKIISQENQGASAARNRGLVEAQGTYFQFLDADDLLAPHKVSDQVALLEQNPANLLAICGTTHFLDGMSPEDGIYHDGLPYYDDSDDPVDWLIRLLGGDGAGAMVQPAAWLVPRALVAQVGAWNETLTLDDDGEYFARIILASAGIRRSPTALTYYRKYHQRSSLSSVQSPENLWSGLQALNLKAEILFSHTQSERAKRAIASQYLTLAATAYPLCSDITDCALEKVDALEMLALEMPVLGGERMKLMQKLLGWKVARRLSWEFHQRRVRVQNKLANHRTHWATMFSSATLPVERRGC